MDFINFEIATPKFSIISINFNNAEGLNRTMESVFNQTLEEFEYIVVDGGSTDGSVETIQQFNSRCLSGSTIYHFNWISEPDNGIYHAMNKGIKIAKGEFLLFINSGDILVNDSVLSLTNKLIANDTDICSGILIIDSGKKVEAIFPIDKLSLSFSVYAGLTHPNTFIKRNLFEKFGYYNEENKIVSDWEFFLVVGGMHTVKYQAIHQQVAVFYLDGISSDPQNPQILEETKLAIKKHIPAPILNDIERLNQLEIKMNTVYYKGFNFLMEEHPIISKILFFPLRVINFLLKKNIIHSN
jgi:glycosyltransferase involved in cell wall biosynthesis